MYKLSLRHGHFSHVLVDEAGHTTEPECLVLRGLLKFWDKYFVWGNDKLSNTAVLAETVQSIFVP